MNKRRMKKMEGKTKDVLIARTILEEFKNDVGRYVPETGGMLGCTRKTNRIDLYYFDKYSKNTSGSFYYDQETMSRVYRKWKERGWQMVGIIHSHPLWMVQPSYHDISSALIHMDFLEQDFFYLPIVQSKRNGEYTLYLYETRLEKDEVVCELLDVISAEGKVHRVKHRPWKESYSLRQLRAYLGQPVEEAEEVLQETVKDSKAYFTKIKGLYPEAIKDKVIVCVGTGGARSFLENMARCGVKNFLLMDKDVVSPTNIATQGVFVSEMGREKTDAIKDRILDINPDANVKTVNRFLDDSIADSEFKAYLDLFPNKKPKDYLILGCTDNFEAQKRSSLLALKYGIPYLAAMLYKDGAAAELTFYYEGVTPACPRCLLRNRFEAYENGFVNDVTSAGVSIFATERMNSLKGMIALMLLSYHEDANSPYSNMLDKVKNRNFVQIRLRPDLEQLLGIHTFDNVLAGASDYTFMDEVLWIPQVPDSPANGEKTCKLCHGTGDLRNLYMYWPDTRAV